MKMRKRRLVSALFSLWAWIVLACAAWGNTEYYRHVVFDNSLTPDAYYNSIGLANGSSFLELKNQKIPVETRFLQRILLRRGVGVRQVESGRRFGRKKAGGGHLGGAREVGDRG